MIYVLKMKRRYDLGSSLSDQDEIKGVKTKISIYQLPFYVGLLILAYIGILFSIACYFENRLPTPLTTKDEVSALNKFQNQVFLCKYF